MIQDIIIKEVEETNNLYGYEVIAETLDLIMYEWAAYRMDDKLLKTDSSDSSTMHVIKIVRDLFKALSKAESINLPESGAQR